MKGLLAVVLLGLSPVIAVAGEGPVMFRVTVFETPDTRFVQEMQMRHAFAMRTGSFEYADPANRRYVVEVGR